MSKLTAFFRNHLRKLMQIRDTPQAIAGGVAIGAFIAVTPLFGVKTLLALGIAWLGRCSKIAAVAAVTLSDVILPIWPLVFRWQYILGFWLIHQRLPPKFAFEHHHLDAWLEWQTLKVLWPTLIGSVVMAIPLTVILYFVTLRIVARYQSKQPPEHPLN